MTTTTSQPTEDIDMSQGGAGETDQLMSATNGLKTYERQKNVMNQYQQDWLKWSENVDKRYAWVVLIALWLMMATTLGSYRLYSLIYAKVTEEGIYTRGEACWPVSAIDTVENTIGPFVSIMVYHIGFRNSLFVGSILVCLGNGLTAFSSSLILDVLLIGLVQGIGSAFIFMPFMEIVNNYFLKYRSMAMGFALSGGTMSIFVLSPIFQWILETFPWRMAYLGISLLCCINLLLVPFLKPNPVPKMPDNPDALTQETVGHKRNSIPALAYQNDIKRQSTILVTRRTDGSQASIVSVSPFTSPQGLKRRISPNLSQQDDQQQRENCNMETAIVRSLTEKDQSHNDDGKSETCTTLSMNELGQNNDFKMSIIWDVLKMPAFHLIWYTDLVYFWIFSISCLALVDYGVDRGCSPEDARYLLIAQSIGELIGRLGLTVLVDMRLTSNKNVVTIDFFLLAGLLVVITHVTGFVWMAIMTASISATSALLYIILNGLLVDCLGEQQVTIGYGMASFIGGVLMSFRPQAVGYFRDTMGSYDWLMICLAISCALGAILWIIEPLLTRLVTSNSNGNFSTQDETDPAAVAMGESIRHGHDGGGGGQVTDKNPIDELHKQQAAVERINFGQNGPNEPLRTSP